MNEKEQVKNEIKQDILDNLDTIVQKIYEIINGSSEEIGSTEEIADNIFMIVRDMEESQNEREDLDRALGKKECPFPVKRADGSVDVYSEIDIRTICAKVGVANEIFRYLYKWRFHKDSTGCDLPGEIMEILDVYKMSVHYESKGDMKNLDKARSWLISVALIGAIRWLGKANEPYLLDSEIEKIAKKFIKNLQNIHNVHYGEKYMSDPNNNGLALFDVENSYSSQKIKFIRRK